VAEADCQTGVGIFQGDDTLCSGVSCPQPDGACCLSNGNCLLLTDDDCGQIPNSVWAGALTDCTDADMNGTADDCELECFTSAQCNDGNPCTQDSCNAGHCAHQPVSRPYGDLFPAGGDGIVDVDDIACELAGFINLQDCPAADLEPCGGDGDVDVDDIVAELDAFIGVAQCPDPC
jgi:hypothetical protein